MNQDVFLCRSRKRKLEENNSVIVHLNRKGKKVRTTLQFVRTRPERRSTDGVEIATRPNSSRRNCKFAIRPDEFDPFFFRTRLITRPRPNSLRTRPHEFATCPNSFVDRRRVGWSLHFCMAIVRTKSQFFRTFRGPDERGRI